MSLPKRYVEVRTARLVLRPVEYDDWEDFLPTRMSGEALKYSSHKPASTNEEAIAWVKQCVERENCYSFALELIGSTTLRTGDMAKNADGTLRRRVIGAMGFAFTPEIGYMLDPDHWGKGFASEALNGILPTLWDHVSQPDGKNFDYMIASIDPEHIGSIRVVEKAGFHWVETKVGQFQSPMLGLRDTAVYRLERSKLP